MDEDRELEEIRRRKLQEIQNSRAAQEELEQEKAAQEAERARKMQILRQILDPKARERLSNLRLVKPDMVENVENQLIQLYSMGRINRVINDDELKQLLGKMMDSKREIHIERR
ncbi:DNA-binding protein [Caldiplasma sukawensis]